MIYEEYCAGCCRCRSQSMIEETKQQTNKPWWHNIIGSRNYSDVVSFREIDFHKIMNYFI